MTVIQGESQTVTDSQRVKLANRVKMLLKQGEVLIDDRTELDVAVEECIAALDEKAEGLDVVSLINELEEKYDEVATSKSVGINRCVLDYEKRLSMLLQLLETKDCAELIKGQPLYEPPKPLLDQSEQDSKFVLKQNKVPRYIYLAMDKTSINKLKLSLVLTKFNYIQELQKYLWIEEAYQNIEMEQYTMTEAYLNRYRGYFVLKVPGLEQNRPSLMPNDTLLLTAEGDKRTIYQGYIHLVRSEDVLLKFNRNLHKGPKSTLDMQPFTVNFQASRTSFKWLHHGVCQFLNREDTLLRVVFPERSEQPFLKLPYVANEVKDGEAVGLLDQVRKGLNKNQLRAVINVLNARNRPAAYLIHGCPGGGKSRVVVEIVHQIYRRKPHFSILVCGNSNSCADLLAERLLEPENLISTKHIVRIASQCRLEQPKSAKLEQIMLGSDELKLSEVKKLRVIVTTCIKAGSLNSFPGLKFDYVIVDEAGHASEPETLIPIGLLKEDGCAVLVGDWFQLGPLCLSAIARKNILSKSLLERLAEMWMYQRKGNSKNDSYDATYITKLNESYRSDPRVLAVNNDLFYESELICKNVTPPLLLKHMGISNPLVFYPIESQEQRKSHSPSWCNPAEIFACIRIVQRLYKFKTKSSKFSASNIGIVTPYGLQIEQFNFWFDKLGISKCKIGTVENYQGDERDVIIISTVRASEEPNPRKLQFLFQPKRFNVATSRARFLTILVGHPRTLTQDEHWSEFIKRAEVSHFGRNKTRRKPAANNKGANNKPCE